jgi:hypothetical protein
VDYFVWYDGNAAKTSAEKIQEAAAAYRVRFARAPQLVLVHSADLTHVVDMELRAAQTVQPNTFWLGV